LNIASYVNPAMDELLAAARSVPGCAPVDRAPLYEDVQELVLEDAPYDFTYSISVRWAYNNRIQNMVLGPWSLYGNVEDWTLAQ